MVPKPVSSSNLLRTLSSSSASRYASLQRGGTCLALEGRAKNSDPVAGAMSGDGEPRWWCRRPIGRPELDTPGTFAQLYDTVRDVRKEDALREERGLKLREAVARLSAEDVLLAVSETAMSERGVSGAARESNAMEYIHLFENEHVSMGIFLLPAGSRIPLHCHPGMTVVSKVLCGALHVTSYDWVGERIIQRDGSCRGEGVEVFDGVVGRRVESSESSESSVRPETTRILFPSSGGNLHRFRAVSNCAVLDVICPPYDVKEGRTCTYYRVRDGVDSSESGDGSGAHEGGRRVTIVEDLDGDVDIATICDLSDFVMG